jgi:hypothetical protein
MKRWRPAGHDGAARGFRLDHRHLPASAAHAGELFARLLDAGLVRHEACSTHPTLPADCNSFSFFNFDQVPVTATAAVHPLHDCGGSPSA